MRWQSTLTLVLATSLTTACARNPVTGARELTLVSESQEIQMGQEAAQQVEAQIGLVDDAGLQAYVRQIGTRLAAQSERPEIPWRFGVLDDPTPNAFALPGGPIYITRGLMSLLDSEAELASVLGHEIGHITARHSVSMITRAQLAQLGLGIATILRPELQSFSGLLSGGLQLLFLKYGRDAERQADELGFRYALTHSYDVSEMDDVFLSLQRIGEAEGRSPLPSWASSHPDPGDRAQTVNQRVAALPAPATPRVINRPQYLAEVDGLIYGINPRHGFFRGSEFLHPDLRFRITFPQGWQTQNLPQAVVAVSPRQDAIIELTFAQGSPIDAARAFFSQQGVQQGQSSNSPISGNPAYASYFRAATQQGEVGGLVTFLSHGGNTYRILAYTPLQQLNAYDGVFRSSVGTFSTVTDPQVLNVRPNTIDVVRIESRMTLEQFNSRYPSVIPLSELAIVNQVQPGEILPAGSQVKRVVTS